MNKNIFVFLIAGIIFLCLITAGCITTPDIVEIVAPEELDPIIGTWTGENNNPNGYFEKHTMVFNKDGTGKISTAGMGMTLPSNFTWTKTSDLNYQLNFAIAGSGFSQKNALVMDSDEKTCSVIAIEFTKK
ncbi:MAG TPA: hypothetical protein O0X01_06445 [Methanocorpusculum sp.]|nr:hypothetical protein [Methanocorpusculum sp.]